MAALGCDTVSQAQYLSCSRRKDDIMFCPRCGDEYEDGFAECADCHVPLVPEPLPPEPEPEYVEYEPVLRTYDPGDISIIKAILGNEGIIHIFEGEFFNMLRPMVQPARLLVKKDQVTQAKEALKDVKLQYFALSIDKDDYEDDAETDPAKLHSPE